MRSVVRTTAAILPRHVTSASRVEVALTRGLAPSIFFGSRLRGSVLGGGEWLGGRCGEEVETCHVRMVRARCSPRGSSPGSAFSGCGFAGERPNETATSAASTGSRRRFSEPQTRRGWRSAAARATPPRRRPVDAAPGTVQGDALMVESRQRLLSLAAPVTLS